MQPVWVLSVDLQTKTATFQSGLSDAAKSARGAFTQIQSGSGEMGRAVSGNMSEARHGVILLGEEFGIHLPRGVTSFLASIGPVGAAMEAAFPFLAIAVGATILIEKLVKMHEEGIKLTDDQAKFAIATTNAFNQLDAKLIQAEIRSDELKNDHLGALTLQLKAIDNASMEELTRSFEEVAKAADVVMKELEGHWYTFGIGSDGAKSAMEEFKTKYEGLLALHTDAGKEQAHNLLTGTLKTAQEVLQAQRTIKANRDSGDGPTDDSHAAEQTLAAHKASLTVTKNEMAAQEAIVNALQKQAEIEGVASAIKKIDSDNATRTAKGAMSSQAAAGAREAAESQVRMGQQAIAADRAVMEAQLTIKRASIQERLTVDLDFSKRELDLQLAGNAAQIAALDRMAPGYTNALKALHDKALELEATHDAQVAELTSKASVAQANKDLAAMEQGEREKIEATQKGSTAWLAQINEAIKQEEAAGLQDTNYYRELLNQRVQLTEQMTEEQAKLQEQAGHEQAEHLEKMGELAVQAEKQADALIDGMRRVSAQQRLAQEIKVANDEYNVKVQALARQMAALDKGGKDYENKLRELQDKEKQATQAHENEITDLKEKAELARLAKIKAAEDRARDATAQSLTQTLMRHQSFAKMITSLGDQVVSGMMENAIKSMLAADMSKEKDAAKAARTAFNIGMSMGGPAGIILGPVMGAAAFASVMAFQGGTDSVPGVGTGDIVPAKLEPGEGVVPKSVMGSLRDLAKNGGMGGGVHYNIGSPHFSPTIHALDADGVDEILEKHADKFHKAFEHTVRKLNR